MKFNSFTDFEGSVIEDIGSIIEDAEDFVTVKRFSVEDLTDPGFEDEIGDEKRVKTIKARIEPMVDKNNILKTDSGEAGMNYFLGITTDEENPQRGDKWVVGDDIYEVVDATVKYGFAKVKLNKLT